MLDASTDGKIVMLIPAMMLLIDGIQGISCGRSGLPAVTTVMTPLSISMMASFFASLHRDWRRINEIF